MPAHETSTKDAAHDSRPISIRPARSDEFDLILAVINAAAEAYRGAIPDDCWREPYMPADELRTEMAAGVGFRACTVGGELVGVVGKQRVGQVDLIRHAYVLPKHQARGIGRALLNDLLATCTGQVLIGTWAAATWAVKFYERYGFRVASEQDARTLLPIYWAVPKRQMEVAVVLALPAVSGATADALVAELSRASRPT